ncbi:hypothetical protein [Microbacterium aurum]
MSLTARRNALFLLFALPGVTIASWITRTPDIRELLDAGPAVMGLVLAGLSIGSMAGILVSGPLMSRFGTRAVIQSGTVAVALGAVVVGVGSAAGLAWAASLGLCLFGLGMGGGEIALNVEGAEMEALSGKSTLPALHGFFSLGTVVGALAGNGADCRAGSRGHPPRGDWRSSLRGASARNPSRACAISGGTCNDSCGGPAEGRSSVA